MSKLSAHALTCHLTVYFLLTIVCSSYVTNALDGNDVTKETDDVAKDVVAAEEYALAKSLDKAGLDPKSEVELLQDAQSTADDALVGEASKKAMDSFGFSGGIGKRFDDFGFHGGIGKRFDDFGFHGGIGKRRYDDLASRVELESDSMILVSMEE